MLTDTVQDTKSDAKMRNSWERSRWGLGGATHSLGCSLFL